MAGNYTVQDVVHSIEQGPLARIITYSLIGVAAVAAAMMLLFVNFKGITTAEGMDQAQIAREIARGNGFTTKTIRPAAIWQIEEFTGEAPTGKIPETYHAPANPFLNAIALSFFKSTWAKAPEGPGKFIFTQDRVIAGVSMVCFFAAVGVSFLTIRKLFDFRIASLSAGLVLLSDLLWEFTLSGLPQMLMLLLLASAIHLLVMAICAQEEGGRIDIPLALAGVMLGLLFLTHHGMILVFVGAMAFAAIWFRPRGLAALWMAGFFLLCAIPWLVRSFMLTGNPGGLALYAILDGIGGSEAFHMRSLEGPNLAAISASTIRERLRVGLTSQPGQIVQLLGLSLAAPVFFLSLLHQFRKESTAVAKWMVFCLWAGATLAAALLGPTVGGVHANQFQVLFIPIMTAYGLAFLLVLWNRLEVPYPVLRIGFIILIFALSSFSFLGSLVPSRGARVNWPPYLPPFIGSIGGEKGWMKADELTSSDIPWAVAWYADRDCVWLPQKLRQFYDLNDFLKLGRPVRALFLTPVSSDLPFFSGIIRGEYSEWLPLITRSSLPADFPLTAPLPVPVVDRKIPDMMFLADYPRWDPAAAEKFLQEQEEKKQKESSDNVGTPPSEATPSSVIK